LPISRAIIRLDSTFAYYTTWLLTTFTAYAAY